ncbi:MAG: Fic family protein [Gammaproteobacteria bacterium]|nr:Fic family protein [Gammaproteobacteria bacterium]
MTESRYHARGSQAEFEPGSRGRVLRNRLGLVRVRDVQRAESEALLAVQDWAIGRFGPAHRFTAGDVSLLHRHWLGEIYPWAGEYRQVNVSKGGFMFAAASQVPRLMHEFEARELARYTPSKGLEEAALVEALAHTHAELVLIHPFREGNGRCARLLGMLMALQAGWPPLDFGPLSGRGKKAYFAALQSALARNYAPLERCFSRVLFRTSRAFGVRA